MRVSQVGESYADRYACIWNGGQLPNQVEYDLEFPVAGRYVIAALYTAHSSRPVDIYVDNHCVHQGFRGVTGSWQTQHAQWEMQCTIDVTVGQHTIKLQCPGPCLPHVCALRFHTDAPWPSGWKLDRTAARRVRARTPASAQNGSLAHVVRGLPESAATARIVSRDELVAQADDVNDELAVEDSGWMRLGTPWLAEVERPDGPSRWWELDPAGVRRMLAGVGEWIDDYRGMPNGGADYLAPAGQEAARYEAELDRVLALPDSRAKWETFWQLYRSVSRLQIEVGLANPLLDFERLVLVRRGMTSPHLGLPQNWQSNCALPRSGYDDEIAVLNPVRETGTLSTLYRPDGPYFVGDVDLHFDAARILFSSIGSHGRWHVFELGTNGTGLRQLTPGDWTDVDSYDACYLPDDRIVFGGTASMIAVPCVNGSCRVANLYSMDADGANIRQLCFHQERNWCPKPGADPGRTRIRAIGTRAPATDRPTTGDRQPGGS